MVGPQPFKTFGSLLEGVRLMSSFDLYQTVTDQILAMLESGVVPFRN